MFGLNYRKRALAAEAKAKDLEAALAIVKNDRDSYRDRWLATRPKASETYVRQQPRSALRSSTPSPAPAAMAVTSASSYAGGGFDMTSALLGGLAGYAVGSSSHSRSTSDDSPSSFSSGGGGDYGGGGASSSWDSSSSCSSSSDSSSSSSSDSGSCSSSSSD